MFSFKYFTRLPVSPKSYAFKKNLAEDNYITRSQKFLRGRVQKFFSSQINRVHRESVPLIHDFGLETFLIVYRPASQIIVNLK